VAFLLSTAGGIARSADYFVSYEVTLDAGFPDVTNILIAQKTENGGGLSWAYSAEGGLSPTTTTINDGFVKTEPITANLLIGLTQGLSGFPPTQKHVVLMISDASAALADNIAWGTLFPTTLEANIIAAIELATSGQPFEIIQPGIDAISDFIDGEGSSILGPGGFSTSTYFGLNQSFTVMAFTDGKQIGAGQSITTPVPEPSSFVAIGVAGLVLAAARRFMPRSTARG
jgi:hypothetical protein